jgi:excisionase family DNA binding protein
VAVTRPTGAPPVESKGKGGVPVEAPRAMLVSLVTEDSLKDVLRVVIAELVADLKDSIDGRAAERSKHLTVDEAASELRCSIPTVRRYIACGRLTTVRLGHGGAGRVLIPRRALDDLIAASRS